MPTQKGFFKRRNMAPLNTELGTVGRRAPGSREKPVSLVWRDESPIPQASLTLGSKRLCFQRGRVADLSQPRQQGGRLRPQVLKQDPRVLPQALMLTAVNATSEQCFGPSVVFCFFNRRALQHSWHWLGPKNGAMLDGLGHLFLTLSESAA